jgi:RNase P subunit RPR2
VRIGSKMDTTYVILVIIGALVVAAAVYFFTRTRDPKAVEYLNLNCPKCKRKLRYLPRQAGHKGACPRCNQPLVFPEKVK